MLGLRANGPALTTLPVLANVGTTGGSITHATYNGGFISTFYLVNTGTAPADFTLSFFDESGSPLTAPLWLPQSFTPVTTPALTRTLAPGAMLVIDTDETRSSAGRATPTGTQRLESSADPVGQEARALARGWRARGLPGVASAAARGAACADPRPAPGARMCARGRALAARNGEWSRAGQISARPRRPPTARPPPSDIAK